MADRNDEIDLLEESRRLMADMEETYVDFIEGIDNVSASLQTALVGFEEIAEGSIPKQIGMDTAVKIEEAIYLPELGGVTAVNAAYSVPSPTHAVKTLRAAIASGALAVEKPNGEDGRKQFLTRNLLKEWRTACQGAKSTTGPSSASVRLAMTKEENSATAALSTSTTQASTLRQDAVSAMLETMRKRKKPQS